MFDFVNMEVFATFCACLCAFIWVSIIVTLTVLVCGFVQSLVNWFSKKNINNVDKKN